MSSLVISDDRIPEDKLIFKELCPGILELNTLSNDYCSILVAKLEQYQWKTSTVAEVRGFSKIEYAREDIRSSLSIGEASAIALISEVTQAVEPMVMQAFISYWGLPSVRSMHPQFTKYNVGHFIKNHTDDGAAFPRRVGSAVTYLTDSYEGGEICFPKFRLQLKPQTGVTLLFPSEYVHSVAPVTAGTKAVFLFFVEVDA